MSPSKWWDLAGSVEPARSRELDSLGTQPSGTEATMMHSFVQVAVSEAFGEIHVGSQCRVLYAFTQDLDGEPTCVDDCATSWPGGARLR